ncbi:LutC/YkgG family protein [Desertivirga arenae]|uniref:LutC/YkgG family protein n=1 Tax=Desertivirga arenae TaxID=2810309 RepID=UPI001A979E8C|nr:LUD domain-containing protein [Pedobacter sp. SYSU D00823]
MSSRDKILAAVRSNKPGQRDLPEINIPVSYEGLTEKYTQVATAIGARVYSVESIAEIKSKLNEFFDPAKRWVASLAEFSDVAETNLANVDPHSLEDVELSIIEAVLAVAENGASWVPEQNVPQRIVPFICQHLVIIVPANKIVPTLHQAYEITAGAEYGYGAFIAGPSKTADIEQSLVLGAHGPRSLTIFILS